MHPPPPSLGLRQKAAIGAAENDGGNNASADTNRTDAPDADRALRSRGADHRQADDAKQLIGDPPGICRNIPAGSLLTLDRLDELVPVEPAAMDDRQVIEWDKDDIDALKFMKVDVLGLGMLGCMRRAFDLLDEAKGQRLDLASIPAEDPATYAMIRQADTMGTFQSNCVRRCRCCRASSPWCTPRHAIG